MRTSSQVLRIFTTWLLLSWAAGDMPEARAADASSPDAGILPVAASPASIPEAGDTSEAARGLLSTEKTSAAGMGPHDLPTLGTPRPFARPQDRLYALSTRSLNGCPPEDQLINFDLFAYVEGRGWQLTDRREVLSLRGAEETTLIYVHGNRTSWSLSLEKAQTLYQNMIASHPELPPIRFVLWSWPSDQIRGQLADVRYKAQRARLEGHYLASFMGEFPPDTTLSLIGFSYGAAVVSNGLHNLAVERGQEIDGPVYPQIQVALYAGAMLNRDLLPGGRLEQATTAVDQLLILYNPCDPVLLRYYLVEYARRRDRDAFPALGLLGLPRAPLYGPPSSLEQWNVSGIIGRTHEERGYLASPEIMRRLRETVLPNRGLLPLPPGVLEIPRE